MTYYDNIKAGDRVEVNGYYPIPEEVGRRGTVVVKDQNRTLWPLMVRMDEPAFPTHWYMDPMEVDIIEAVISTEETPC